MKVIDLFNKIANGEEVPRKIKYRDNIYVYTDDGYRYDDGLQVLWLVNDINIDDVDKKGEMVLNKEIEIIEEDKKIEKLTMSRFTRNQKAIAKKVNEVIDYINKEEK